MQFSVLMSVYKKEKPEYLRKAIESILNQTLKANEIVMVIDGPITEELNNVLNEYDNELKIVKLEKNIGLGNALNLGLKECNYNIVARMDTDDIALKERFEKQIKYLENHPEIDVIGSNVVEYDEQMKNVLSTKKVPETNEQILKNIKKRNPFNHMSVIFNKTKVIKAGGYMDCLYFEDYYLWCRLAKLNCNFYNIQETLMNVRTGLSMYNRRGGIKYIKSILNFQIKIYRLRTINILQFLTNIIIRIIIAILPNKMRQYIYLKKIRTR